MTQDEIDSMSLEELKALRDEFDMVGKDLLRRTHKAQEDGDKELLHELQQQRYAIFALRDGDWYRVNLRILKLEA